MSNDAVQIDHSISIAIIEEKLDSLSISHGEQLTGLRRDIKCVKEQVTVIDKKLAMYSGGLMAAMAVIQMAFKFFG